MRAQVVVIARPTRLILAPFLQAPVDHHLASRAGLIAVRRCVEAIAIIVFNGRPAWQHHARHFAIIVVLKSVLRIVG